MLRSNSTLDDNTPRKFLKLTKKCLDQVEGRKWMVPSATFTPYIYNGLCKHLIDKLRDVVESAQAFLILFNKGSPSSKASLHCLEVFELLYDLANAVKHFIQSCCPHAWMQTAVCLSGVSKHITSLGFNLEIMRLTFLKCLDLSMIDAIYVAEAEIVTKKAITDRELLLKEVSALLEIGKSTSPYYQLATCVYERLQLSMKLTPSEIGLQESLCIDEKCLKQTMQLGRGAFATVYRASWLGMEVAKKTFLGGASLEFEKEVSILLRLSHPNITSLVGYAQGNGECSIIVELMDEELYTLIQRKMKENKGCGPPFAILEAIDIMLQIGGGMQYLREKRIVHRDLKSMNILVKHLETEGSRGYVLTKVSDFGLSKTKEKSLTFSNQTPNIGSTRWMAPELIKLHIAEKQSEVSKVDAEIAKYPYSSDVYNFAMVCYEILTGKLPYCEDLTSDVRKKVLKGGRPELPNLCHPRLKHLVERCWSLDPSMRPSFDEICAELRHLKCLFLTQSWENCEENLGRLELFTINQLQNATKNFNVKNIIGYGRFGNFYKGVLSDGTLLTIKSVNVSPNIKNELDFQIVVEVISKVANRHLLRLYGFCSTPSKQWLVYPYMPNGSVASHLRKPKQGEVALSSGMRKHIALGAAKGLAYLHEQCNPKIIHKDVTPDNIFLDDKFEVVVGNFGLAMPVNVEGLIAPEYMSTSELSEKTDVYGYGITLMQLITGQNPIKLNWVKQLMKDNKVKLMVDPFLKEYDMNDIQMLLSVALLCTQDSHWQGPR